MKRFKRIVIASVVATTIGLSGCDALNEGYEVGMTTVEFVQTQERIFTFVADIERRVNEVEQLDEIIAVQQQVIGELKQQKQQLDSGEGSEMLNLMSGLLIDDVVVMLENNVMMLTHLAPMHMSIGERFEAVSTQEGYKLHTDKLLALQKTTNELSSHVDSDVQAMLDAVGQSTLHSELQVLLVETLKSFNSEYKQAIIQQMSDIPATVTEELQWIDYMFEHQNVISVDENDEIIFATQAALDKYNATFGL